MPFQVGHKFATGKPKGAQGVQRKENFSARLEKIFEGNDPDGTLKNLLKDDPKEFLKLYAYLMPKDTNMNAKIEQNLSDDQLQTCVKFVLDTFSSKRKQQDSE